MRARHRTIREVLDAQGRGLVSRWVEKDLTLSDRAAIESRFNQMEINATENPNWIKFYKSLKLWEIRIPSGGKALRVLCAKDSEDVILLIGCVKKGQIKGSEEALAAQRNEEYRKGKLDVRDYPLPQRPPGDVEEPHR